MSDDKTRAAFEVWASSQFPNEDKELLLGRNAEGEYTRFIEHQWEGWQARAALTATEHVEDSLPIADWLEEAANDVMHWGGYASDYFRQKWDLAGCIQKYTDRALEVRSPLPPAPKEPT